MIRLVVSGGQTGADQGGWEAALECGIMPGGWMPAGFKTEAGNKPEFARRYRALAHESPEYPPRTLQNARYADVTLWFGNNTSRGFHCTRNACNKELRPFWEVGDQGVHTLFPATLASLLTTKGYEVINVAGNAESNSPGIQAWVKSYLVEMFKITNQEVLT